LALYQNFTSSFTHASLRERARLGLARVQPAIPGPRRKKNMKINCKRWIVMLGALVLVIPATPRALAECGLPAKTVKPTAWHPQFSAHVMLAAIDNPFQREDGKSIVGMWHVIFTANTSMGKSITPMVVDNTLVVWHNDGTEIMNSMRPPQDGNFCMGVWEQTGRGQYYLNHFAWFANEFPNGTTNGIGDPVGPTHFVELVTLSPDGNRYTGTFKLDAYDANNNIFTSFTGTLSGTRITTSTTEQELVGN
jgi:hypothetical protein